MAKCSACIDAASVILDSCVPIDQSGSVAEHSSYIVWPYAHVHRKLKEWLSGRLSGSTYQWLFGPLHYPDITVRHMSNSRSLTTYDPRILIFLGILLLFPLTYLMTSFISAKTAHKKTLRKEPPLVPFWTPVLGNIIPFLTDGAAFASSIT